MKIYVYSARDKKLGAYQFPEYKVEDPEHVAEGTARALKVVPLDNIEKARLNDQALYYLGSFDDISGKFDLLAEPEKLIDYEDYLPRKDEVKDGQVAKS